MYPDGPRTTVYPGPLGAELEGGARPTHFAGMLTVVLKLLQIVAPDRAFFGEKDYQQLVLVRQMVADLNVDVHVVGVPIVREADGLAMSSRNRYLSDAQREQAGVLSAALLAGTHAAAAGAEAGWRPPERCCRGARDRRRLPGSARQPAGSDPRHRRRTLLVAARLGKTRLLDNIAIDIGTTIDADGRVPSIETSESHWRN